MLDFSQLLRDKISTIMEKWVAAVRQDDQLTSAQDLTQKALEDSLPKVMQAMSTVLSQSQPSDIQTLLETTLEHGLVRAEQGFDASEIAREYRILRWVIFAELESDLIQGTPIEILRAVRLIDTVIDEAIARCFKSYTEGRLQELELLQNQLILTNRELTRLVRASETNLTHLAHELKTPLTSIIGYSDLFLRQQRQKAEVRDSVANLESIERVLRSGRQLLHLINDSLELSRSAAGEMQLQPAVINVGDIVHRVVEVIEPLANEKQLQLNIRLEQAPEQVVTDPLRLQQVITNLVSNAIRYTDQGSVTLVCHTLTDQTWAIAVQDTGRGIAPEDQTQIFKPFFRANTPDSTFLPDSTGLGLAIVSRLVRLMQGEITVSSQMGLGSTFTVTLPLCVATVPHTPFNASLEPRAMADGK